MDNRSLWNDEVYLATSLISMDFRQLATSTLEYQQKAPIGFLWLVKLSVLLFGKGEMALRLVPFLCGLATLFLFMPVVRYFLKPLAAILAVAMLALSPVLVFHAVEIKQYSTEMLSTVLSLYLYIRYKDKFRVKSLICWGIYGAVMLWFSYAAILVLAGIALGLSLYYLLKKDWSKLLLSMIPFSLWLFSFGLSFYLFIYKHTEADWLVEWFRYRGGFLPQQASFGDAVNWLFQCLYAFLEYPLDILWSAYKIKLIKNPLLSFVLRMAPLFFLCWALGYVAFFRSNKKHFLVLILPLLLTLLAAVLEKYPFFDRLLVFLAPISILVIARGCERLTYRLPNFLGRLRYALPLVLLLWPLYRSTLQLVNTDRFAYGKKAFYREAFLYVKANRREGDQVYLYWNMSHTFNYYNEVYELNLNAVQLPDLRNESKNAADYLNRLKPHYAGAAAQDRIWFIYNPYLDMQIGDYDDQYSWYKEDNTVKCGKLLHQDLGSMGKEVYFFKRADIGVALFDLTNSR